MKTETYENRDLSGSEGKLVGVVLAGGLSRRMNRSKAHLWLDGRPMLSRIVARLRPQVDHMIINYNGAVAGSDRGTDDPADEDLAQLLGADLPIIADAVGGFAGPLAGILAAMEWAARHVPSADWIVSVPCDSPFFPPDMVQHFLAASQQCRDLIVIAEHQGRSHPVFGLWPISLRTDLRDWLCQGENRKILAWVDRHQQARVPFEPIVSTLPGYALIDPFFNVNTPDDLTLAHRLCHGQRHG